MDLNMYILDGLLYAGAWCENCIPDWQGTWLTLPVTDGWQYVALTLTGPGTMALIVNNSLNTTTIPDGVVTHIGDNNLGRLGSDSKTHLGDFLDLEIIMKVSLMNLSSQ